MTAELGAPAPGAPPAPRPGWAAPVLRYVRRCPAAIALALVVIATAVITGTWFTPATTGGDSLVWSAGVAPTIEAGFWWTPLTALFVPNDPVQLVVSVVLALTAFAIAERLMGTLRAILAFLATGLAGTIAGVLLQWAALSVGEVFTQLSATDTVLDPTIGMVGALITASAFARALWRRRIRVVTFAIVAMFVLYNGDSDNLYRLLAGLGGLALGALLARGHAPGAWRRSSLAESRNLIAVIVAVTGLGPIIALTSDTGFGPLSFIAAAFSQPSRADVLAACADTVSADCDRQLALASAAGVGPVLLGLVPLLLLVTAAIGLRKGRRFAYLLAVVVNVALVLLTIGILGLGDLTLDAGDAGTTGSTGSAGEVFGAIEIILWLLAGALVPVAVLVILMVNRRRFGVRAPRAAIWRFGWIVTAAFVVLAAFYLVIGGAHLNGYTPSAGLPALLLDTVRRFVPTGFDTALGPVIVPKDAFTLVVYQWVGPVFWAVFVLAVLQVYGATRATRRGGDEERFRALLKRSGGGTLGFMGTWPDNVYWFSDDGEAAVAYRVINGVAITLSDPVCEPDRAEESILGFVAFCEGNSWTPVFYSFHEHHLPVFDRLGWQHMSVGEETLMHPPTLELTGKAWQKVRQPLNKLTKEGVTTLWTTWDELPLTMANEITAISEQWVSEKSLPEMGFTLGGMAELKDPDVALFLAVDASGGIQAVTSWLPSYRDGRVVGWTIDFMRRGDNAMSGVMEFVIASAALRMKEEGVEVLSLSGAPLATKPEKADAPAPEPTAMTGLLEFLGRVLEPAYGFSSLFRFKSKFNPSYETMYMAYPDPLALPAIGAAIGKAYLPNATPKEYLALVRTLGGR